MENIENLYITNRKDWRRWLVKNHKNKKEIWLIYYRKGSGKTRISYDDAVLEALCYGWIDGKIKGIDNQRYAQRFSPRKHNSSLSQMNKERIRQLIKENKMTKDGLAAVEHLYDFKKDTQEKLIIPNDILKLLKENKQTWENFQNFPESYKRIRIAYILTRKKHGTEMYEKSLKNFIRMTAKNKNFGLRREFTVC
ncbi:MAG: YdeI/OmpD-associated family protein [archaeon]